MNLPYNNYSQQPVVTIYPLIQQQQQQYPLTPQNTQQVIFSAHSPVLQQYQNLQVITIQSPQIQQQQRINLQPEQQPTSPLPQQ
jgi:hypothetical protein